jgi:PAS domain S-box-containing protein
MQGHHSGSFGDSGGTGKYEALLAALPDMMFVLTKDGTYVEFKAENEDVLLIPPEEIVGKKLEDSGFPDEDVARFRMAIDEALETGKMQTVEYEIEVGGRNRFYETRIVPFTDNQVVSIVRDISDRKAAAREEARHRQFLRQVIDINPNFVFAKDREGRFTLVNQAVADAYGTSIEVLTGKTDSHFNPNPGEVRHFREDDLEVIESGKEKFIPEEIITDAAGNTRWLQTVKRPLVDPDGKSRQVLGVAVDITRYKIAEAELMKTSEALREEREALSEKNTALRQILEHIESERKDFRDKLIQELEKSLLPEIRRLRRKAGDLRAEDFDRLESTIGLSLSKDVDGFQDRYAKLSPREIQICELISEGLSSKEMSEQLSLSLVTIHKHRERIRRKLGLTNMGVNLGSYLRSRQPGA